MNQYVMVVISLMELVQHQANVVSFVFSRSYPSIVCQLFVLANRFPVMACIVECNDGWRPSNICTQTICDPPCLNDATCIAPWTCACQQGND
jgi:hypothetical protein